MQHVSCGIQLNHELIAALCKWWCSAYLGFIALLTHTVLFDNDSSLLFSSKCILCAWLLMVKIQNDWWLNMILLNQLHIHGARGNFFPDSPAGPAHVQARFFLILAVVRELTSGWPRLANPFRESQQCINTSSSIAHSPGAQQECDDRETERPSCGAIPAGKKKFKASGARGVQNQHHLQSRSKLASLRGH